MKLKWCLVCLIIGMVSVVSAKTIVDPTRPNAHVTQKKGALQNTKPEFVLSAVFINNKNKYAVINGENYQEGQEVQGNKLILVSQNHVVLNVADGKKTLFINNHSIKKDINNDF
jgi:MSHA biogenesis protein MshK